MCRIHKTVAALCLGFLAATAGRAADDDNDQAMQKELAALEGNWQCTREEGAGRLTPEIVVKGFRLIIEGKKYQTIWGGKELGGAATILKLDPTANPKTIDIEWTSGATKDQPQFGIYKLNKDKLEICWAEASDKKRPKKFTTTPGVGSGKLYSVYEREKD
jgi:uncharacterized protein (TIGR03067 family)